MTKHAIIMPTINVPPNLVDWSKQLNPETDVIIIAGNERTPHDGVEELLTTLDVPSVYLHPDGDRVKRWSVERYLDPNDHHRHALALLEAMTVKPDVIITLDDDNFADSPFWVEAVDHMLTTPNTSMMTMESPNGWYDVGRLCEPRVVHRGYPHWMRHDDIIGNRYAVGRDERVGVFASLWHGDPDIDATERIVLNPLVTRVKSPLVLALGTWSPFNSQSTAFRAELAPLLMMWPGVGRFDDIFASYLARAYMDANDWFHAAGSPTVRQDRNPHDLVKDVENEIFGWKHSREVIDILREFGPDTRGMTPLEGFDHLTEQIDDRFAAIPAQTTDAFLAWSEDVRHAIEEEAA